MTTSGRRIINGLKDAIAGNLARVTIDGQTWVRNTIAPLKEEPQVTEVPCQKGNNPMYEKFEAKSATAAVSITAPPAETDAEKQRRFLGQRVIEVSCEKVSDLRKQFKIDDSGFRPRTAQEALARLTAGGFTIRGSDKTDPVPYRGLDYHFSWRGPDDKADRAGYDAAYAEMSKLMSDSLDKIRVADPKDGLTILEAFKDWTFTPAPVVTAPAVA